MTRPLHPAVPQIQDLDVALSGLEQAEGFEEAYDAYCALVNRVDNLLTYIAVLCRMTKVRPEKLDDLLRIATAHKEFEEVLRGKGPLTDSDSAE